jgi:flagellar biosynthesis protein FlhB
VPEQKPFDATPSRLARARREGDVPRSTELAAACSLAAGGTAVALGAAVAAAAARAALVDAAHGTPSAGPYVLLALCALAPCFAAAAAAAAASSLAMGAVHVRAPSLDFGKLAPAQGIRRMLSARTAVAAGRAVAGAAIVGFALEHVVREAFLAGAAASTAAGFVAALRAATLRIVATAAAAGLALGILDALYERAAWRRRLRMTFAEMKRDLKESEGDVQLRGRRRAQHRALVRGSLSRLPEASFVVANPSHVAIALQYDPPAIAVPRVLVRAIEEGAQLVKARARALNIPIVEDALLARTLLAMGRVDEPIPHACYLAVARIVAYLSMREAR